MLWIQHACYLKKRGVVFIIYFKLLDLLSFCFILCLCDLSCDTLAADSNVGPFDNIAKIVKNSHVCVCACVSLFNKNLGIRASLSSFIHVFLQVYEMDSNSATPGLSALKILSGNKLCVPNVALF